MLSKQVKRSLRFSNIGSPWIVTQIGCKNYGTQAELNESKPTEFNLKNARPSEEVPGPSKLEFVRGFLPGGLFYKKGLNDMILILSKKYGNLYRIPGLFGNNTTYATLNPKDYPVLFRNEGKWPIRRGFSCIEHHRKVHRPEFFEDVEGLTTSSGEQWAKVRTVVNPILMQPKNAKLYFNTLLDVNYEFLERIRTIRDPSTQEMPDDFEDDINRLTLESVAAVAMNTQLGLIHKNRHTAESKTIIETIRSVFELAYDLEIQPPIWRYIKTPQYKKMMKSLDTMLDICNKYISEALSRIEHDESGKLTTEAGKEKSVLEKLAKKDKKIAVVMALDMMLAGVDTTSTTITSILICIGKNPEKQAKLLAEIKQILPEKSSKLTIEKMNNLPYLRACIKEAMRLYPIGPGTLRETPYEIVLSGYRIPAGVDVVTVGNLQMCDEEYVPHAKEFIPERWLRDEQAAKYAGDTANSFMYLPFGYGPRSCVGKRIVDMELEISIAHLVRNFNIEFNYPIENAFRQKFIMVPNIPLKFKFEERNN
ncbi:probable cytochrome P450 12e1, mitochondrial [Teleopsis dalmanni]|nr:probable cytochrome P450 12e1, mitochondrial [Teleopsis dalmanni]